AAIQGFTPTVPPSTAKPGSSALSSDAFMKLMITQLQQQDPLNPSDSNQLLTQMSQISQLQSNTQLTTSLQSMSLQQAIGSAGNLIGKSVAGIAANGNSITGTVTSVKVADKKLQLELDSGLELPMENVTTVAGNSSTNTLNSTISSALNSIMGSSGSSANS